MFFLVFLFSLNIFAQPTGDIIVSFQEKADLTGARSILNRQDRLAFVYNQLRSQATISQSRLQSHLQQESIRYVSFFSENAMLIKEYPLDRTEELQDYANIRSVQKNIKADLNFPVNSKGDSIYQTPEKRGVAAHLKIIKADAAWEKFDVYGEGIVVAGQDTGYFWQHNALKNQYRGNQQAQVDHNYNWLDAVSLTGGPACGSAGKTPCDNHSHGTHTIGSVVGDDGQGNQIGVAPKAQWIGCRNMDDEGVGTVASYLACFDFFLAPYPLGADPLKDGRPDLAPHIVNNSWACPVKEGCRIDQFVNAVQAYKQAGILLVTSAGNTGPGCGTVSKPPAVYSQDLLVVGAYNRYGGKIAWFSSLGPSAWDQSLAPNIIAPGGAIRSAMPKSVSSYADKMGTSMAAPQVAGVAALLWSKRPELIGQIEATMEIIMQSATPMTGGNSCPGFPSSKVPNAVYGWGMLNAVEALSVR